ncbi:ATP-dependent helicase [Serratia marcescens]|nr:ATP-dependent helicase [Serratia marcescens]
MKLTEEQKDAINYDGNMVLTACPGSGKTTVIVNKVAKILSECKSYQGVIAISYTNKSSDELKKRCAKVVADTKSSFFGTIDKFYMSELIIKFMPHLWGGIPNNFITIKYNGLSTEKKEEIAHLFSNELVSYNIDEDKFSSLRELYISGVVVMELIPLMSLYVLKKSKSCLRYLTSRYKSIFIDEYQDSGYLQHLIFLFLSKSGIVSTAVGDIDQSIYGYSGRSEKYLLDLRDNHIEFKPFTININHRCHPSIVNYANRLKNPNCELLKAEKIHVFRKCIKGSQKEIADWIDAQIPLIVSRGYAKRPKDIAILTRANKSAEIISSSLTFPNRVFLDDKLSKLDGRESQLLKKLILLKFTPKNTAQSLIDEFGGKTIKKSNLVELRKMICAVKSVEYDGCIALFNAILYRFGLKNLSANHIDAIQEVFLNIGVQNNYRPTNDDEVQVLTLHKSKGLEFDFVFHVDLYDWILPQREYIEGSFDEVFTNIQQCLNLHYVGVTRAKNFTVLMTSTQRFNTQGQLKKGKPSQFFLLDGLKGLYTMIDN